MKKSHFRCITVRVTPAKAQNATLGEVLTVVVEMLQVLTLALTGKELTSGSDTTA